jgi:hypothetical protein
MAEEYELGTVGPIPTVNPNVAKIGEMLKIAKNYADRYYVKDYVPLIGGTTLGEFLLGKAPEEVERWGQGDYPFRNPSSVVGTGGNRLDVFKTGRFEPTFDVAMNVALPLAGAAKVTKNMPIGNMMIGPESKIWDKEMAFNARKLEAKGETPEQIYEKTGMVRGLDNQWRQEISDQFATMKGSGTYGETVMNRMSALGKDKTAEPVTLNDVFYHPKLSEAYPELMNTEVQFTKKVSKNKGELVHTEDGYIIRVNPDMPAEKAKSTILHEIQHAIQGEEGFNRGANYAEQVKYYFDQQRKLISEIEDLNRQASVAYKANDMEKYRQLMQSRDVLSKKYGQIDPEKMGYEDYLLHGGEAEARLTQNRIRLSEEERMQNFPYEYAPNKYGLDINPDEAIISTQHPRSINDPVQSIDFSKIPTKEEYEAMVGKGQMRQARTFDQNLEDTLSGKVPGNKFDIPMEHAVDYESGDFTKRLEKAGLHVYDDKYGTVFVGKTKKDLDLIKNAETPIEHGLSFGYTPEDIAKFYTNRRGGRADIGYTEYLDDLKYVQNKYASTMESTDYRGAHKAPKNDDYHSPGYELDRGMYPEDVYGPNGYDYYGSGDKKMDMAVWNILREARGDPDYPITVYRAVPAEFKDQDINPGDWVTPSIDYAHQHGLRFDNHHIIEKTVPAKHIWSEGNSLHEFGYDPTD